MQLDSTLGRTLTELDHARLIRLRRRLAAHARRGDDEPLEQALEEATVVASRTIPRDVVTMRSRVLLKDLPGGEQRAARLEAIVFQPESNGDYTL